jgi:hypothetical protein
MIDRSTIWIGISDLLLCILSVVICAVSPHVPAGAERKAEFIVTLSWSNDVDADVDAWLNTPKQSPVYFHNRQVGCSALDMDNHGWVDSYSYVKGREELNDTAEEVIAIRCKEAGHYDFGANLFGYSQHASEKSHTVNGHRDIRVNAKVEAINPTVTVLWQGFVTLQNDGETINIVSWDMAPNGDLTFVDPPLTPITAMRDSGKAVGQ